VDKRIVSLPVIVKILGLYMVTDIESIKNIASEKHLENLDFQDFLKFQDGNLLDSLVENINKKTESSIDCTECGNCCKSLMINVSEDEANDLSQHLQTDRTIFDATYLEKGSNGLMLMNTIPCNFLSDNKCTVYAHRFAGCKEFPAMHLPNFKQRLFTTFMHYERCPIIFNVVESLKTATGFTNETN